MGLMIAIVVVVILIVVDIAAMIVVNNNKRKKMIQAHREKLDREAREFYQKQGRMD